MKLLHVKKLETKMDFKLIRIIIVFSQKSLVGSYYMSLGLGFVICFVKKQENRISLMTLPFLVVDL